MGFVSNHVDEQKEYRWEGIPRQVIGARDFHAFDLGWRQRSIHLPNCFSPNGPILKELELLSTMCHCARNYPIIKY